MNGIVHDYKTKSGPSSSFKTENIMPKGLVSRNSDNVSCHKRTFLLIYYKRSNRGFVSELGWLSSDGSMWMSVQFSKSVLCPLSQCHLLEKNYLSSQHIYISEGLLLTIELPKVEIELLKQIWVMITLLFEKQSYHNSTFEILSYVGIAKHSVKLNTKILKIWVMITPL
jgi:hypothetical protein